MMNLSAFMVLKNGITLGYPFVEAILSLLPVCDEFVICEGYSDDDTWQWLERLQKNFPERIRLSRQQWPQGKLSGGAIGEMQTQALRKCRGRWCYLLQADEIMPPENLPYLRELCAPRRPIEILVGRRRFNSYRVDFLHLMNNFQHYDSHAGYRWAIRLVRNRRNIISDLDGWQLKGPGCSLVGTACLPRPVYHVGYNFPINTWRKRINHAQLYPDLLQYQQSAEASRRELERYEEGTLPPLSCENPFNVPPILSPLIGEVEYHVRAELLEP
jgi:glycosyltransferase involved in cell wall biosynthesis